MAIQFGPSKIPSVVIGTQTWMLYNLDVTKYRNGDDIPQIIDNNEWFTLTTGAWCYYNHNSANGPIYGKLYNWYAVNDARGLAPAGYHVPSDIEWTTLTDRLGGVGVAGGPLKETGITYWNSPNTGATNSSGFTGRGTGFRNEIGNFFSINNQGYWWTSTENNINPTQAWYRNLYNNVILVNRNSANKLTGHSIRCIKD
jgi:uncharacterized protein (TIGR02145 family)